MMTHMKSKFAAVGLGAAALGLVVANSAMAASVPVTVGGHTSGNWAVTATAGTVAFSAQDATVVTMGCTGSSVPLDATHNFTTAGASVANPATLGNVHFTGCTGPGGAMAVTQLSTWYLEADSGYTSGTSDTVSGVITNVDAHVATTPLSSVCSFDVVGQARGTFDEANQTLTVGETGYTGNLTLTNVSGCGGQLNDGDPADFSATYTGVGATSGNVYIG
jgi:hypothetical protein